MRSLPATGRRLLQAISTKHVRSVLSSAPLTTARMAPAKALASGAAVVAAGALLIPTGQAVAQGAHPADQTATTAATVQAQDFRLPVQAAPQSEQAKTAKAAVVASLDGGAGPDAQARPQDEQASRSEQRTELQAAGQDTEQEQAAAAAAQQQAVDQAAAEQAAAAQAAAQQQAAEQQAAAEKAAAEKAAADQAAAEQAAAAQAAAQQQAAEQQAAAEKAAAEKAAADQAAAEQAAAAQAAAAKPSWSSPAPGAAISNPYHKTNAAYAAGYHTGTDFAVSVGTPVLAVGDATVVSAGYAGAYGNQIVLKLSDGRFAQYAHLSQLGVKAGQHVGAGDQVGKSGNTGNSHGPHLHFEIRTANQYAKVIDPVGYLKQHGATNF
ncbi:M23 family metallopeptidase [Kitasatospora cineracea]|uniref:Murein DD-endopeptidase MepM/ murein hydrolase activator NlpD n=1 Tax=Kitasatospora cineracea TaxID=88074 RepID=A0A3N4SC99_9ACTN|nr:M23 family metallopeptidase [Kitasatospora cineracea]RPE34064.1 murein DD-endopeptidase MepM/ murein hydrolase activator NlpD [Kitasatospora cineracea]